MSRIRRSGRFIPFVSAFVIALIISACGSGLDGSSPSPVEKSLLKVGILPIVGAAPAFLASDSGYFAEEGLEVEFVTIQSGGTALGALRDGQMDVVFGNYVSFFAEQAKGTTSLKFIADGYYAKPRTWMMMVPQDSNLVNTADIAGKRVAVTIVNGVSGLIVKSSLDTAGSGLESPEYVEMPYPDMGAALLNHTVDAALLAEPFVTDVSMKYGAHPLFDAAAGPTLDLPVSGYATTDDFSRRHPNTVAAFQRALSRGVTVASNDRSQVEHVVHKYAEVNEQTAALMPLVGFPMRLDARRLQRIPDLMMRFGMLARSINSETMILPSDVASEENP